MDQWLDWYDISETKWGSDATGGKQETVTATLRLAGEDDGQDELAADLWGAYGLSYRPAKPDADGTCQALGFTAGGKRQVLATRDLRAAEVHGALNEGDVCVWSVGRGMLRCNADGMTALIQRGPKGSDRPDARIGIEPDGTVILSNEAGQIELSKASGFVVTLATGEQLQLGPQFFQAVATQGFIRCGVVGLGVAPSKPLATGSGAAVPIPHILG